MRLAVRRRVRRQKARALPERHTEPRRPRVTRDAQAFRNSKEYAFKNVKLEEGYGRVEAWIKQGEKKIGVHYVDVRRVKR